MPFRQIFVVLVALIAILGAALFVLSWGEDDPTATETDATTTTTSAAPGDEPASTITTTTTEAVVTVTTSIPVDCAADEEATSTTSTSTSSTSTSTTTEAPAEGDEGDEELPAPEFPTLSSQSSISTVGLDEVTFGLTVRQAERVSGTTMDRCGPVNDCYRVTPADAPEGISFLVHEGTIERVDIVAGPIQTLSDIGIGATLEDLDGTYGDKLEYVDLGGGTQDVIFVPSDEADAEFRVAFTTVDGEVTSLRAGRIPLVLAADPCA